LIEQEADDAAAEQTAAAYDGDVPESGGFGGWHGSS
jgi:hypothetical protein